MKSSTPAKIVRYRSKKMPLIFLLLFSVLCCKKNNLDDYDKEPLDIKGKWLWEVTYQYNPGGTAIPSTPQSTGIEEIITYYANKTWSKRQNNIVVDTGGYSTGRSNVKIDPWTVEHTDSIQYYKNGLPINGRVDYYFIIVDSMNFAPWLGGLPPGESKWLIRQ
jgi:hypothetical protein